MTQHLPPLRLTGAMVLSDGALRPGALTIRDGMIDDSPGTEIRLSGYDVLPGAIDLHATAFGRSIGPLLSVEDVPIAMGLAMADREFAAHGITTAWLSQGWSWEGGLRGPDFAERLMAGLQAYRPQALTDMRTQICCETHMPETRERLIRAAEQFGVDYVLFTNSLPKALRQAALSPHRLMTRAERDGSSFAALTRQLGMARDSAPDVPRHLCALAHAFDELGVTYGSYCDADGEARDNYHHIGARLCAFPKSWQAASVARVHGNDIVIAAPEIIQAGQGRGSRISLMARNASYAIASGHHSGALRAAVDALVQYGAEDFAGAWEKISTNPARIMGLTDRGTLEPGKRADLVVMNAATRQVEATISGGQLAHLSGPLAERFLTAIPPTHLAAE